MPIDLAAVNGSYVAVLAVLAFLAASRGQPVIASGRRGTAALLSALAFAALFVG